MTDQHPLTDEICRHLADTEDRPFTSIEMDNMRAAADWQLEQVIEWLRDTHEEHIGLLAVIKDLREAMRPTTTQKDN
jgi:iron-sulfur cluster repair protein YtfE (RIC family)